MKAKFLPYGRQSISDDDIAAVVEVLQSDYLTTGSACPSFEEELCRVTDAAHAVACSSGTAALHLAMAGLGLGKGDVVIVPTVTFLATANAARYVGAEVVFADVDPDTGLMTPKTFDEALSRARRMDGRAHAAVPVHLGGQSADVAAIAHIARDHGMFVIEDACHALGTMVDGVAVGACRESDAVCFSFHPVKMIAMGEGGGVTTSDADLAAHLRSLRGHAMVSHIHDHDDRPAAPGYYEMHELGFNYRASDIHCALGLSQLGKLKRFVHRRRALVAQYDKALAPLAPDVVPVARRSKQTPAWHLFQVLVDFAHLGLPRAAVMTALRDRGIGTQVHYIPVHRQPYYRARYGDLELPGAERFYERTLSLPLFEDLTDADVARVVDALVDIVGRGAWTS